MYNKNELIVYEPQNCSVYLHICKYKNIYGNKGVYIGITYQKLNQRWKNGNGYKSSPHFYNAIQKYGWNNFEHKVLINNVSLFLAKKIEEYLINKNNTNDKKFGYNLSSGGEHMLHNKETKIKMSKIAKSRTSNNLEKYWHKGKLNHNFGVKRPFELVKQIAEKHEKSVICVETGIIYKSIKYASIQNNVDSSSISSVCKGKRLTAGGYHWKYIINS